jgi:hypothetical protein
MVLRQCCDVVSWIEMVKLQLEAGTTLPPSCRGCQPIQKYQKALFG